MKDKCISNCLLTLLVVALATISVLSSATANDACTVIASGDDSDDSGWVDAWISPEWTIVNPGGLMSQAQWIWPTYRVTEPINGEIQTYTRTFNIEGCPTSGQLVITTDNGYEVELNGVTVGRAQLTGDSWDIPETRYQQYVDTTNWQSAETWDVSDLLQTGTNTLVVTAVNEYTGPADGQVNGTVDLNPGGLIYKLDMCSVPQTCRWVPSEDEPKTVRLFAGQDIPVGYVEAYIDGNELVINFITCDSEWNIEKTHLYVFTTAPTSSAPRQFNMNSYETIISDCERQYRVPLPNLGTCNDPLGALYIAAHAVVSRETGEYNDITGDPIIQTKTSWGEGDCIPPCKIVAMSFVIHPECSCECPE